MNHNYHLNVGPTELKRPFDEEKSYTVRLPLNTLMKSSEDFLDSLLDTANVAFSHNDPGKKEMYINVPKNLAGDLRPLKNFFVNRGMSVRIVEGEESEFVQFNLIDRIEWTCVDRRLDDLGAGKKKIYAETLEGQITHPGSIVFLHPLIAETVPPHHWRYLRDIVRQISENRWKIGELVLHAGIDGAAGCGGVGVAKRGGANIDTIEDHVSLIRDIRDSYHGIMDPFCNITAQLVDPENRVITVNTDDAGELRELLRTRVNV